MWSERTVRDELAMWSERTVWDERCEWSDRIVRDERCDVEQVPSRSKRARSVEQCEERATRDVKIDLMRSPARWPGFFYV